MSFTQQFTINIKSHQRAYRSKIHMALMMMTMIIVKEEGLHH